MAGERLQFGTVNRARILWRLNWTAEALHRRVGEYWHMLPEAAQARKAIWDSTPETEPGRPAVRRIDQAFPIELRAQTRDQDMMIRFKNNSLWRVVGSDNFNSLVGSTPIGVVFSEWALSDPTAWGFLRPILAANNGWAMFITTPRRGASHAKKIFDLARQDPDTWFSELLTAEDTGALSEETLANELREMQHLYGSEEGRTFFRQEYFCSWHGALIGGYYGSYLERAAEAKRIGNIPIDRSIAVCTGWDLGISDSTAIWFIQVAGREFRLIDYFEASGVGLDHYAKVLEEKAKQHGWLYGKHYFPHDVAVRELSAGGRSRIDTLRNLGIKATVVPQHNVNDGINAVRKVLDCAYIDQTRCARGLDALRNYRRQWDERLKMLADKPLHDWSSHGSDALRTFSSGYRDEKRPYVPPLDPPRLVGGAHERNTAWMARR